MEVADDRLQLGHPPPQRPASCTRRPSHDRNSSESTNAQLRRPAEDERLLWAFDQRRIAVRFQYEWHNDSGQWFRSYGNELWEFDDDGLMRRREASINDVAIAESDRKFLWPAPGPRPADHPGIPDVQ